MGMLGKPTSPYRCISEPRTRPHPNLKTNPSPRTAGALPAEAPRALMAAPRRDFELESSRIESRVGIGVLLAPITEAARLLSHLLAVITEAARLLSHQGGGSISGGRLAGVLELPPPLLLLARVFVVESPSGRFDSYSGHVLLQLSREVVGHGGVDASSLEQRPSVAPTAHLWVACEVHLDEVGPPVAGDRKGTSE